MPPSLSRYEANATPAVLPLCRLVASAWPGRGALDARRPPATHSAGNVGPSTAQSDTHKATRAEVRKRAALTSSTDPDAAAGSRQGRSDYRLALSWLDRGIGTVMWALNRRGAVHNTLTVFTSDHGSTDKGHCYSRSLQVPLLMQWPDLISPMGAVAVPPASLLDVAATFLHAATDATNASLFAPTPARSARVIAGVILPRMPPLPSLEGLTPPPLHGTSMLPALPTVRPIYRRAPLVPAVRMLAPRALLPQCRRRFQTTRWTVAHREAGIADLSRLRDGGTSTRRSTQLNRGNPKVTTGWAMWQHVIRPCALLSSCTTSERILVSRGNSSKPTASSSPRMGSRSRRLASRGRRQPKRCTHSEKRCRVIFLT